MNEQDVIVPAVAVPNSTAKNAKKSVVQILVTAGSAIGVALVALVGDPDFFARAVDLAGDNKSWVSALVAVRFAVGFILDRRKHTKEPNLVEVQAGY